MNNNDINSDTERIKTRLNTDTIKSVSNHYNYTTINNYNNFNESKAKAHSHFYEEKTITPQKINVKSRIKNQDENNTLSMNPMLNLRDKNNSSFYVTVQEEISPIREKISMDMFRMPTLKNEKSDSKTLNSKVSSPGAAKRQDSRSSISAISNISHYRKDSLPKEQKIFKMKINNPYIDIFSKKEIEVKLDTNNFNDSFDNVSIISSLQNNSNNLSNLVSSCSTSKRKISVSDFTDKTPSFSKQEYLFSLNDEGVEVIKITNITKYNIPIVPTRNKSFSKDKFLKVPDGRSLTGTPTRVNSMGLSNSKGLSYLSGEG
jgi:hypothetical protein